MNRTSRLYQGTIALAVLAQLADLASFQIVIATWPFLIGAEASPLKAILELAGVEGIAIVKLALVGATLGVASAYSWPGRLRAHAPIVVSAAIGILGLFGTMTNIRAFAIASAGG